MGELLIAAALVLLLWIAFRMKPRAEVSPAIVKYADQLPMTDEAAPMKVDWEDMVFLDTETTGMGGDDTIVEIAIVDHDGRTLMERLVDPRRPIPPEATAIHGITDEMVRGQPTLAELTPTIQGIVRDKVVAIYNAEFDLRYLPDLGSALGTGCVMEQHAQGGRWVKLSQALEEVGGSWRGQPHRALADARAARDVSLAGSQEVRS